MLEKETESFKQLAGVKIFQRFNASLKMKCPRTGRKKIFRGSGKTEHCAVLNLIKAIDRAKPTLGIPLDAPKV